MTKANGFSDAIEFIIADSSTLTSADLMTKLSDSPRLVHIDGCHLADYVFHDIAICEPISCEGGLLVLDDAFNFSIPGVTERFCRYFSQPRRTVPFAHCYNKLFLARLS